MHRYGLARQRTLRAIQNALWVNGPFAKTICFTVQSQMAIPDKTSAEAYLPYTKAKCLRPSRGKAWRDLRAWITQPLRETDTLPLPAVSEPYLAWTYSGEAEFQEREGNGPWITHRIKKGSFFLTTGGRPYDCRWKALTPEPFLSMMTFVVVELPLLKRAMEEVFGANAAKVRLCDLSAFTDPDLNWSMERVWDELMARRASVLRVQGLAQMIATHLARNYAEIQQDTQIGSPSLPGFKLKQVTDWIEGHLASAGTIRHMECGGMPVELHLYEKGGHGFGIRRQQLPSDQWIAAFEAWLFWHGFIRR